MNDPKRPATVLPRNAFLLESKRARHYAQGTDSDRLHSRTISRVVAIGFKKFIVGGDEATDSVIDYLADPQARGDYYTEGGQAVLRWLSTPRLQRVLGLGGPLVEGRTRMRMLLEGRHPVTGELIRRWGPN